MRDSSINTLAAAYGVERSEAEVAVYALAEQVHQHYCLAAGIVNHRQSRPDEQIAVSILNSLVGLDWWLVRSAGRLIPVVDPLPLAKGATLTDTAVAAADDAS